MSGTYKYLKILVSLSIYYITITIFNFILMRPIFEKIDKPDDQSFYVEEFDKPHFSDHWHFHPEIEILYVREGYGTKYVGDSISSFHPGELVIIGSDTPHVWVSSSDHLIIENKLMTRAVVILFTEDFFEKSLTDIPELNLIKKFLNEAKRGMRFVNRTRDVLIKHIEGLSSQKGMNRLIGFLTILDIMSTSNDIKYLSAPNYKPIIIINSEDKDRMEAIFRYVIKNYQNKMLLKDIASIVNLTPHSFCRYFKSRTGKVFTSFVNEVRIANSCKQILDNKEPISQISFATGFNYLSNFNRQFKKIKGMTPSQFHSKYKNQNFDLVLE
jgi:AraC-like DNA-binding protein